MKTLRIFAVILLGLSMALVGCSKWNQDPLSGKNHVMQDGSGKPTKPEKPEGLESEAIRVDTVDIYSFKEERKDEFNINARVLVPDYTFTIAIENLSDFPGATYDAASGKFAWTPAKGTVLGNELSTDLNLKVKVIARGPKETSPVLSRTKEIRLTVSRAFNSPEVVSVSNPSGKVREGDTITISAVIRDKDSNPSDKNTWPMVQITNVLGAKSLAGFVSVQSMDAKANTNGDYDVRLRVDLGEAELTKDVADYAFGIKASSRFNQISNEQRVNVKVLTSFGNAVTTWTSEVQVVAGQTLDQQFTIFDPKGELQVTYKSFANLPAGANAACNRVSATVLSCGLVWKTELATVPNTYRTTAKVELSNQDSWNDSYKKSQDFQLAIKVLAPPVDPGPSPEIPIEIPTSWGGH